MDVNGKAAQVLAEIEAWAADDSQGYDAVTELLMECIVPFLRELLAEAASADLNERYERMTEDS